SDPTNKLANYTVTLNPGTLTVSSIPLLVTADDKSRGYGQGNPVFSVHYSGFVLGQDANVLAGTLGFGTPAMASSNVGSYAITPGGLTSPNYALSYGNGTLTVTPVALYLTAQNKSRLYGGANPEWSGTLV